MAEIKTVELQIKSNVNTASKEFDDFAKSIKAVDNSATNLDYTFKEVYGDLQPLTTRMGEAEDRLYELALAGKQSSQEFKDLLASVGNYRKTQIQTDMVVDAAATTLGQKLTGALQLAAGGFSLVQGSMSLFGSESEDVEQAILKVQSAMAITQGIESITLGAKSVRALGTAIQATTVFQKASAAAQYVWNAAMAANPIGVVVASITALLIGGYKLIKFFKDSSDANEKATKAAEHNTRALKNQSSQASQSSTKLQTYNDHQYNLAKAAGASSEELRKLALKHKDEEVALNKKNAVLARATFLRERDTLAALKASDASDDVIAKQEELTKSSYDFFKKQNEILSNSYKERAALRRSQEVEVVAERKAAKDKAIAGAKEDATDARGKAEKRLEDRKKEIEKFNEQELELNELTDSLKDSQAEKDKKREDDKIIAKADADLKRAEDAQAKIDGKKLLSEELLKLEQEEKDAKLAIRMKALNDLTSILGTESKIGKAFLIAKQLLLAKELAMEASKTITFSAQAAARSTVAVAEGAAQTAKVGFPQNVPLLIGYAAQAAGIISAIRGAVKSSKSSIALPSIGSISSNESSAPASTAAPQFNVVGTSGQNQIAQSLGNQAPVKAYVVSNDVTTAQSLDRNIVKTATVG